MVEKKVNIWEVVNLKNLHQALLGKIIVDLGELDTYQLEKVTVYVHNMVYTTPKISANYYEPGRPNREKAKVK